MEAIDKGRMPHDPETPFLLTCAELRGLTIAELYALAGGGRAAWDVNDSIPNLEPIIGRLLSAVERELASRRPETLRDLCLQIMILCPCDLIWEEGLDALRASAEEILSKGEAA